MLRRFRSLARRLVGVERVPTYYLPWLTRPGLECVVLLNNIESRFTSGRTATGLEATVTQHDADGRVVGVHRAALRDSTDTREVRLPPTAAGHGFVTVAAPHIRSDLYVALVDGESYTATHGRQEFVEHYPAGSRAILTLAGGLLGLAGRTIPAFARDQYVYRGPASRSHLLLMNLSKREQGRRFESCESDPNQRWRIRPEDWRAHRRYGRYRRAFRDMVLRTSKTAGRWSVIPADDRRTAEILALEAVARGLARGLR